MAKDKKGNRVRDFDERQPDAVKRDTVETTYEVSSGDSILIKGTKTRKQSKLRGDLKDGAEAIERINRRVDVIDVEIKRLRREKIELLKALGLHDQDAGRPKGFQLNKAGVKDRAKTEVATDKAEEKALKGIDEHDDIEKQKEDTFEDAEPVAEREFTRTLEPEVKDEE